MPRACTSQHFLPGVSPVISLDDLTIGLAHIAQGRDLISTAEAAPIIGRKPQTLRKYACLGKGPLQPVRINGRLLWRVADIASLIGKGS